MLTTLRSLGALMALALTVPAMAIDVVYVSVAGEKRVAVYQIGAVGGLTHIADEKTAGEPGALTTDPARKYLFAAMRSTGELAAFRIDPDSGKLTPLNTVPAGADPAHISVDKSGKFLLTAYYVAGQVTVHRIGDDGSLSKAPVSTFKTADKAHAIQLDPDERGVLVPHTEPNLIFALLWNEKTGEITEAPFKYKSFETPKNTGPRHVVFHPTLTIMGGVDALARVAYVANEQGGSVTVHHAILNPINWIVQAKQTLPTLPADFKGTNACAEMRLHPTNNFLYVSNRGHDSIAGFQVDEKTGHLTGLGQTATEKTPRSFDIDPTGKYLYAAGEGSGRLATYQIDSATGGLERLRTDDVGRMPWWVLAVRLPTK